MVGGVVPELRCISEDEWLRQAERDGDSIMDEPRQKWSENPNSVVCSE